MTLMGLRVVRDDGSRLGGKHAIVRVLCLSPQHSHVGHRDTPDPAPRDRCALHDLIADTAVVYDDPNFALRRIGRVRTENAVGGPGPGLSQSDSGE